MSALALLNHPLAIWATHASHARPHAHALIATSRYDKYHLFLSRISGVSFLTLLYLLNTMDIATAMPVAVAYACLIAAFGPIYAELKLETKPAHKLAFLMAPLIVTGFLAL